MKEINHQSIVLSRRSFLKNSSKVAVSAAVLTTPVAHAFVPIVADVAVTLALDIARSMAGFIFNKVGVVTVKVVKKVAEEIVEEGIERAIEYAIDYYQGLPDDQGVLDRDLYRQAVIQIHPVRIGLSPEEYEAYHAQSQKIILSRDEDLQRFEEITRYLVDTKTRIYLPKHNISDPVTSALTPENLISGRLRFDDPTMERHYEALLERTGVDVFNKLAV